MNKTIDFTFDEDSTMTNCWLQIKLTQFDREDDPILKIKIEEAHGGGPSIGASLSIGAVTSDDLRGLAAAFIDAAKVIDGGDYGPENV